MRCDAVVLQSDGTVSAWKFDERTLDWKVTECVSGYLIDGGANVVGLLSRRSGVLERTQAQQRV